MIATRCSRIVSSPSCGSSSRRGARRLHLRKLIHADAADDGVFALMGLCQAMLGNFRAAIVRVPPRDRARAAQPLVPPQPRPPARRRARQVRRCAEAPAPRARARRPRGRDHRVARALPGAPRPACRKRASWRATPCAAAPGNRDHRALLEWIERGAPEFAQRRPSSECRGARSHGRVRASGARYAPDTRDPVARLLATRMPEAGFSHEHVRRAQALWTDFSGRRALRVVKPAVYAAAIEYAIAMVHGVRGVTQAAVGRRYGVAPASHLEPLRRDPRGAGARARRPALLRAKVEIGKGRARFDGLMVVCRLESLCW